MKRSGYRILFEGKRWFGSNASSCIRALMRMGHSVMDLDYTTTVPTWNKSFWLKAAGKIIFPLCVKEHNQNVFELAREFRPHIFFAFKGTHVQPETLRRMRSMGIALYNYFPDTSAFSHNAKSLARSLQEYDCVFPTKSFFAQDMEKHGLPLKNSIVLPHGYDPDAHHPVEVAPEEMDIYAHDVSFIGHHTPGKEKALAKLMRLDPNLDFAIWGERWKRSKSPELVNHIKGRPLFGIEYMKALCAAKIALALLIEKQEGASSGDRITSRTFNVPATGAFMIHERNEEILKYYVEGSEIECFGSTEELLEKIRFYLANPDKRKAVAEAGYKRCVPAYSQDNRMQVILDWHEKNYLKI